MILKIFAVYDSKVGVYFTPFFMAHEALAKRAFAQVANDPKSQISSSPADFTLFELGEWNDENGELVNYPKAVNHGLAGGYRRYGNGQDQADEVGDETHVLRGAKGGDPAKHV